MRVEYNYVIKNFKITVKTLMSEYIMLKSFLKKNHFNFNI